MAPRKGQVRNAKAPARGGRRKRARRDSGASEASDQVPPGSAEQLNGVATALHSVISWSTTISQSNTEILGSQVERYKSWRREGSIHETMCRVCLKRGSLKPCHTCRVAFHAECIPPESLQEPGTLFCSICVRRGWHRSPPELTPPPSPGLGQIQQSHMITESRPAAHASGAMSIPSLVSTISGPEAARPLSRTLASQEDSHNTPLLQNNAVTAENSHALTINQRPDDVLEKINDPGEERSRPKRQRKSRFATLPSEVDASLAVLYRELESISSLRMEITSLQNQNLYQSQTIKLRDNSIAILRRDLEKLHSAENELAQLRAHIGQHDSTKTELDDLRAKNAALESELQESRKETAAAQELVNEWRGRLAQLLNN